MHKFHSVFCRFNPLEAVIDVKVPFDSVLTTSSGNSPLLSSAVLFNANLQQLGDEVAPNKCTSMR